MITNETISDYLDSNFGIEVMPGYQFTLGSTRFSSDLWWVTYYVGISLQEEVEKEKLDDNV